VTTDDTLTADDTASLKPPKHPLAVGYWSHITAAILLIVLNLIFMVGLFKASYSVYLEANAVAAVTPAKRLDAIQITAENGRAELLRSITNLGIDQTLGNVASHLQIYRNFYERLLRSDEDFSKLMHLQQNGVTHFAGIIGQSSVWQKRYTQTLLPLPVNSARRQLVVRQTIDSLQELPTLAN